MCIFTLRMVIDCLAGVGFGGISCLKIP